MRVMFSLFAMLVLCAAWANDTAVYGASGTVMPLAGEYDSIRLVHETVRLDIYPRYYDVQAEYLFHNTGDVVTVTMGFPETGTGEGYLRYRSRTAFQHFHTDVDGQTVRAQRQLGDAPDELSYMAWWMKDVSFAAGQQRRVTVAYRALVGTGISGAHQARYHVAGGNWAGAVNRSQVHVRLNLNGTYAVHSNIALLEDEDGFGAIWRDWEAEETAIISFQPCGWSDLAIRGLDIPRELDHLNWLSQRMRILHLRQPDMTGFAQQPFIPAAFYTAGDGGQSYIALRAMQEFFAARYPEIPAPEIHWNVRTKTAKFTYLGEEMRFTSPPEPPSPVARPDAPVAILRSYSYFGSKQDILYVPVETVMRRFGGLVRIDHAGHLLTLHFPTPETGLVTLGGTACRVLLRDNGVVAVNLATGRPLYRFANPLSAPGQTKGAFSEPLTMGTYLLLHSHNDEGAVRLHCYDLATSAIAGKLVEAWQANLTSRVMLSALDQQALYLLTTTDITLAVEKRALADGAVRWRRELSGVPAANHSAFIAEQDGNVALYTARRDGDGITDPAEVIILNAGNGDVRTRYECSLDDVTPERLPRWTPGPAQTRALLNADGVLLAATYGLGLRRSCQLKGSHL